jgi:hypothetical protein
MHKASVKCILKVVRFLKTKCNSARTPLHEVSRDGNLEEVSVLVRKGADGHAKSNDRRTPLDCTRSKEVARFLEKKASRKK